MVAATNGTLAVFQSPGGFHKAVQVVSFNLSWLLNGWGIGHGQDNRIVKF